MKGREGREEREEREVDGGRGRKKIRGRNQGREAEVVEAGKENHGEGKGKKEEKNENTACLCQRQRIEDFGSQNSPSLVQVYKNEHIVY